jgi:hypothetical protein
MIPVPTDRARRPMIRDAALSCALHGEGFFFVGFDWEPHVSVTDVDAFARARLLASVTRHFCWRAVVHVRRVGPGRYLTAVLDVGGDRIYGVSVNVFYDKPRVVWVNPDPLRTLELQMLRNE